jgi:hypothetical protein
VLAVEPSGAHPELDATARHVVGGYDGLGQHRGIAEGDRRDHGAEADPLGDRGQRRDRGPGIERATLDGCENDR